MRGVHKFLAIAVALAIVVSALAAALAFGPRSQGSEVGVAESGSEESDSQAQEGQCPQPDVCAEPGTTLSALAAI